MLQVFVTEARSAEENHLQLLTFSDELCEWADLTNGIFLSGRLQLIELV